MSAESQGVRPEPRGRPLDPAVGDRIVAAAAELLAEAGYDGLTIDGVAARARVGKAAIYRRWTGKEELILETVRARRLPLDQPPDTGSLRGDLLQLLTALEARLDDNALTHLVGVIVALRTNTELADAVRGEFTTAWVRGIHEIVARASARGEIAACSDDFLEVFGRVGPAMMLTRFLTAEGVVDGAFVAQLVDDILLPIVRSRS